MDKLKSELASLLNDQAQGKIGFLDFQKRRDSLLIEMSESIYQGLPEDRKRSIDNDVEHWQITRMLEGRGFSILGDPKADLRLQKLLEEQGIDARLPSERLIQALIKDLQK